MGSDSCRINLDFTFKTQKLFFLFFFLYSAFFDTIGVIFVVKVRGFVVIFGKAETDTLSSGIISTNDSL